MSFHEDEEKERLVSINRPSHGSFDSTDHTSYVDIAQVNKTRRNTLRIIYFTMFIGSISFSIVMSSLWPFLRMLDNTINETFMGYINAAYSMAQMVASIIFGYWCDKRRALEPTLLSIVLLALGSGLYAYAEAFGSSGIWVIFGARVLLGFSGGVISVARSVGAHLSVPEDRAKVMSYLALWQAIGFFIGPALQALSKVAGSKGLYVESVRFYLNIYTAPCYMMIILSIINFILVVIYLDEHINESKQKFQDEQKKLRRVSMSYEPIDMVIIFVCLVLWYVAMSIFALNETIMSPILMNEFAWTRSNTVFYGGIILSVAGVVAVVCFMGTTALIKKFGSRMVTFAGYVVMLIGFIVYLPWGPGNLKLTQAPLKLNGSLLSINGSGDGGGGGCPYQYSWCHTTPAIEFGQYLTAATLVGIGYPVAIVCLSVLYSQIIGPYPQGKFQGWLSGAGCLARVTGPLYVTAMYEHFGLRWTAVGVDGLLVLTLILFVCYWRRLVPYGRRRLVTPLQPAV